MKKTKDTGPAQNGWLAELEGRVGSRMREYERRETTFMCERLCAGLRRGVHDRPGAVSLRTVREFTSNI